MPLQDDDIILLKPFLDYFNSICWINVLLELTIVAELELLCRFLHVFIEDLDVFLLFQDFLDPVRVPRALGREAFP